MEINVLLNATKEVGFPIAIALALLIITVNALNTVFNNYKQQYKDHREDLKEVLGDYKDVNTKMVSSVDKITTSFETQMTKNEERDVVIIQSQQKITDQLEVLIEGQTHIADLIQKK